MRKYLVPLKKKLTRDVLYCAALMLALLFVAVVDSTVIASFLGRAVGHFSDPLYLAAILVGVLISIRYDALIGGLLALALYRGVSYFPIKSWHQELGIFESDTQLMIQLLSGSLIPTIGVCVLIAFMFSILGNRNQT